MLNLKPGIVACLLLVSVTAASHGQNLKSMLKPDMTTAPLQTLLSIDPDEKSPRNSEGDIIELSDGSLALVYTRFTGGTHDESAADLAMRISADGGQTWTEDRVLVENEGGRNVMSVSLLPSQAGDEILLFYLRKDSPATSCTMVVRRSNDDLQTLSDPTTVTLLPGYHVVNNDRVVRLESGRLLVPSALHTDPDITTGTKFNAAAAMVTYYSDDDGVTWKKDNMPVTPLSERKLVLQEPGVVELQNGDIMMYIRTGHGAQYASFSEDDGETWSAPEATDLKSPRSPATIEQIPGTYKLLAVWNDHTGLLWPFKPDDRSPLCAAVSFDGGKHWSPSVMLESDPNGWFCYTSMTWTEDSLLLSYCAGRGRQGGLNRLKVARLPMKYINKIGKGSYAEARQRMRDMRSPRNIRMGSPLKQQLIPADLFTTSPR